MATKKVPFESRRRMSSASSMKEGSKREEAFDRRQVQAGLWRRGRQKKK